MGAVGRREAAARRALIQRAP
ncbi:hypothetical protein BVI2075_70018 [Burkholderia vietnamiensis]|nr:hypothetical protein BVI2075_70018 [Burkholderia vietnamiensis]